MTANLTEYLPDADATVDVMEVYHAIEAANAKAMASLATGDVETYASLFTEDAWSMPPNSPVSKGRAAIFEAFTNMVQFGKIEFDLKALDIAVCGSMAVERGAFTLDFTPFADDSPIPGFHDEGHYLVHWVKQEGQWMIRSDAPVSKLPVPGMAD